MKYQYIPHVGTYSEGIKYFKQNGLRVCSMLDVFRIISRQQVMSDSTSDELNNRRSTIDGARIHPDGRIKIVLNDPILMAGGTDRIIQLRHRHGPLGQGAWGISETDYNKAHGLELQGWEIYEQPGGTSDIADLAANTILKYLARGHINVLGKSAAHLISEGNKMVENYDTTWVDDDEKHLPPPDFSKIMPIQIPTEIIEEPVLLAWGLSGIACHAPITTGGHPKSPIIRLIGTDEPALESRLQ